MKKITVKSAVSACMASQASYNYSPECPWQNLIIVNIKTHGIKLFLEKKSIMKKISIKSIVSNCRVGSISYIYDLQFTGIGQ